MKIKKRTFIIEIDEEIIKHLKKFHKKSSAVIAENILLSRVHTFTQVIEDVKI